MEKSKTAHFGKKPKDERGVTPSCPWWIFGDENSANNDLEKVVEVVDEKENQDNDETV